MPIPRGSAGRRVAEGRLSGRRLAAKRPDGTPLVWVAAATAAGGIASIGLPAAGWSFFATAAVVTLACWSIAWRARREMAACSLLLLSIALLACGWAGASWQLFSASDLGRFANRDSRPVCFEAVATSLPTVYPATERSPFRAIPSDERTVIELEVVSLRDATRWREASGQCEVTISGRLESIRPGDRLRVFGQLRSPAPPMNPGQRDAAARERAQRSLALVWTEAPDCVTKLESPPESAPTAPFERAAVAMRGWAIDLVDRRIDDDTAPLVRAMLLGDGSTLPDETTEAFRQTGTLHVLVVSGLHVGLVAAVLPGLAALGLLPRRTAWFGALLLVGLYVVIAGARPPAVRAGVVASAACLAALAGRRPLSVNSLAGAGVAVFAISPGAWIGAGTQLSFVAAATLLGVASWAARRRARVTPPLERLIQSTRTPWERLARRSTSWVGWVLAATIAVQVVAGPLVASEFHLVSPAATPLALAVSPLIALTVSSGVFLLAAEAIGLGSLAWLAGQVCGLSAGWLGDIVTSTADLPMAGFWTPGPAPWWSAAWIGWAAFSAAIQTYQPKIRGLAIRGLVWRSGLALLAAAFVPTLWNAVAEPAALRCSFIAVGHGSATLLESPDGSVVLIDAGALGSPERVADLVARTLWSRGITRLDAIMLTHPDIDHYNAVPGLLERFEVGAVWTTTRMFPVFDAPGDVSGPAELKRLLARANVPVRELVQGDRLRVGEARLEVMHPGEWGVIGSDNANSLVLGVEYGGRRVLLPGDLESPGTEALLSQEPYDCDVLLAPHHGSRLSNQPGFAAWCRPETVVISSGEHRGEAIGAYADSGARVVSTHDQGMVSVKITDQSVKITPLRRGSH